MVYHGKTPVKSTFLGEIGYTGGNVIEWPGGVGTPRTVTQEVQAPMCSQSTPTPIEDTTEDAIPYGYCQCGCGQKTRIPDRNNARDRQRKGMPLRHLRGHGFVQARPPIILKPELGIAEIPLPNGLVATIDIEDADNASAVRWQAHFSYGHISRVISRIKGPLHHMVIGTPEDGQQVDHIDGDVLNNRKANLRYCTPSQNGANQRKQKSTSSRFKGVTWNKDLSRWIAQINHDGRIRRLGVFAIEEDAARCYDDAARSRFGDFACLNFPNPGEQSALSRGEAA